jgi:hypothetical protein
MKHQELLVQVVDFDVLSAFRCHHQPKPQKLVHGCSHRQLLEQICHSCHIGGARVCVRAAK